MVEFIDLKLSIFRGRVGIQPISPSHLHAHTHKHTHSMTVDYWRVIFDAALCGHLCCRYMLGRFSLVSLIDHKMICDRRCVAATFIMVGVVGVDCMMNINRMSRCLTYDHDHIAWLYTIYRRASVCGRHSANVQPPLPEECDPLRCRSTYMHSQI